VAYLFVRDTDELLEDDIQGWHAFPKDKHAYPDEVGKSMPPDAPRYKKEAMLIKAQFVGANPDADVIGEDRLVHNCNYFYGNNPSKWRTDVPNYSSVTYKDIWPGIDLRYHGNGRGMKYDFIVNPGADMSQIKVRYDGINDLAITSNGDLQADTRFGMIYENIPSVYQEAAGSKHDISGQYRIVEPGVFGFEVEGYNPSLSLVIDPELVYSTYLGGGSDDWGHGGIAVDGSGSAYVSGHTGSSDFPMVEPYDGSFNGVRDVFVTKLSPAGNSLTYSTYLGGNDDERGHGIAADGSGSAYVTGYTTSSDFPTVDPYDGSHNGGWDVFVTKLSPAGNSLTYSTYLGGGSNDECYGIAVDGSGSAHVTGYTISSDFPTQNPYQTYQGGADVFVTKFSPAGNSLTFSTYLGGGNNDEGNGIAVDASGSAYVTGYTLSIDFPTQDPYDDSHNGGWDVFVIKLSPASITYSTYLGGGDDEEADGIAVDGSGSAYVTGYTISSDFPTQNPYQTYQGGTDVFVTKLSPAGNSLTYSTYLGGIDYDRGYDIAVDGSGQAYVTGWTQSSNFPTVNPYDGSFNGDYDVFVTKLSASGSSLDYSTYLGGGGFESGNGIAIDGSGNAYVTGYTISSDFPTQDPYQTYHGGADVFVTKFGAEPEQIPTLSEWGMMIMGLLLLAFGTAALARKRKAALSKAA